MSGYSERIYEETLFPEDIVGVEKKGLILIVRREDGHIYWIPIKAVRVFNQFFHALRDEYPVPELFIKVFRDIGKQDGIYYYLTMSEPGSVVEMMYPAGLFPISNANGINTISSRLEKRPCKLEFSDMGLAEWMLSKCEGGRLGIYFANYTKKVGLTRVGPMVRLDVMGTSAYLPLYPPISGSSENPMEAMMQCLDKAKSSLDEVRSLVDQSFHTVFKYPRIREQLLRYMNRERIAFPLAKMYVDAALTELSSNNSYNEITLYDIVSAIAHAQIFSRTMYGRFKVALAAGKLLYKRFH